MGVGGPGCRNQIDTIILSGEADSQNAHAFIEDLSDRLDNQVQLSSDCFNAYIDAVESAFGANVDYGQVVKAYEAEPIGPGRYSPPQVIRADRIVISGLPQNPRFRPHMSKGKI